MKKISIIVGNSEYENLSALPCCETDVTAIEELLTATEEYAHTLTLINKTATELKDEIRNFIDRHSEITKIFFYFTGHGVMTDQGFFYCAKNFTEAEPNQTGLLDDDLDQILRTANASAVVKVIDACQSGARAIKANSRTFINDQKAGFSNYFRIASCSENQFSYTGDPLSKFTSHFIEACLINIEGKLFYTDIIAYLRDVFANDIDQVPFFVTQGDDRTTFCEDASSLKALSEKYEPSEITENTTDVIIADEVVPELTLVEKLKRIDEGYVEPDQAQEVVNQLWEQISGNINEIEVFSDYYDLVSSSYDSYDYASEAMQGFMIRILEKEDRPDELVYAKHTREYKKKMRHGLLALPLGLLGQDDQDLVHHYDLELNCSLNAVNTKFTFKPKFRALKKLELNVTIAPSLPNCYVFSRWTSHPLRTWDGYGGEGNQIGRKWFKVDWAKGTRFVADTISENFKDLVMAQVARATEEL